MAGGDSAVAHGVSLSPRDAQQEIINLIIDAGFAAAINDFNLGGVHSRPERFKELL